ncbi:hypothetical protein STAS_02560 [Striga asiatica]|uniref:Uncharacterized protein n=1 Tax=Striga asiatica TaxID=4170 RepID=A0A5A7P235_STRAF|nr:hypothetical protein STAS_02560 [Striga asiatica]
MLLQGNLVTGLDSTFSPRPLVRSPNLRRSPGPNLSPSFFSSSQCELFTVSGSSRMLDFDCLLMFFFSSSMTLMGKRSGFKDRGFLSVTSRRRTLEAEGMVLRAISVMLEKDEGMRSFMGRLAKFTILLPNRLPILFAFDFERISVNAWLDNVSVEISAMAELECALGRRGQPQSESGEVVVVGPGLFDPILPEHILAARAKLTVIS